MVSVLDFDDSFTYNIAEEVRRLGLKVQVVPKEQILVHVNWLLSLSSQKKRAVIWGPGPGHPEEYSEFFPLLRRLLNAKNIFNLGVCLGHQLIWHLEGYPVRRDPRPLHGQAVQFDVPKWPHFPRQQWGRSHLVQRYNSLGVCPTKKAGHKILKSVRKAFSGGHLMASSFERGVSYQFHPESVGTSCPELFFAPLVKFLYNGTDAGDKVSI